jgi:hypothetical protein
VAKTIKKVYKTSNKRNCAILRVATFGDPDWEGKPTALIAFPGRKTSSRHAIRNRESDNVSGVSPSEGPAQLTPRARSDQILEWVSIDHPICSDATGQTPPPSNSPTATEPICSSPIPLYAHTPFAHLSVTAKAGIATCLALGVISFPARAFIANVRFVPV